MILEIGCDEQRVTVEVTSAAGVRKVTLDGKEVGCDWTRLADGHYSLIVNGRVHDFIIEFSDDACTVVGREGEQTLCISDSRLPVPRRDVGFGQTGVQQLRADMPGKVVRVLVNEGDAVEFDQSLIVLEAMKMQNEIRAPKSGIVRGLGVTAGATVNTGQFLLSLE